MNLRKKTACCFSRCLSRTSFVCLLGLNLLTGPSLLYGQPTPAGRTNRQSSAQQAAQGTQVVIKRDAIHILNPETFQAPLALTPTRILEIRAGVSGTVQNIRVAIGAKVSPQEELVRIESSQVQRELNRARAGVKAATLKRDLIKTEVTSGKQPQLALDLASAELEVAQADLELAQAAADQTSVRAPFAGQLTKLNVIEKAAVNERDLLLEIRDLTELQVRLPVNREAVKEGDPITLMLGNVPAEGKVQAIFPLDPEWQPLRQLVESAATALVILNNSTGAYQDGQTVYASIVPRQPIVEVPNQALKNSETGKRVVQVIRDSIVRDLEVQLLGPVGETRSFISGPFQATDELITESSRALSDGTVVRANAMPPAEAPPRTTPGNQPSAAPAQPGNPAF